MNTLDLDADLNTIVAKDDYLGQSGNTMTNKPAGIGTASFGMFVWPTSTRWVYQLLIKSTDPSQWWIRRLDTQTGTHTAWVQISGGAPYASPYAGKMLVCLGDSLTDNRDWPTRVKDRLGFATAHNCGIGGSRLSEHPTAVYQPFSVYRLAETIQAGTFSALTTAADTCFAQTGDDHRDKAALLASIAWANVSHILVFAGTNDYAGGSALGAVTDTTGATVRGALNIIATKLQTACPKARVMFATPFWRQRRTAGDGLESDANPNGNGVYLIEYVDAIKEMAARHHLPALDLYRNGGINIHNHATMLQDGLHQSDVEGNILTAEKVASFIAASF